MTRFIMLYRPTRLDSLQRTDDGYWMPIYSVGPLRAKMLGIRVPVLWAIDRLMVAGRML